jgi:hypothetical protein
MVLLNRFRSCPIASKQHATVFEHSRSEQPAWSQFVRDNLGRRKAFRVLLETFQAEELGKNRLFQAGGDKG